MWPFDTSSQPQTLEDFQRLNAQKEAWKSVSDEVPPDDILWMLMNQGVKAPVAPGPTPVGIPGGTPPGGGQTQPSSFTPGGFMDFFVRNVIGMPSPVPGVSVPHPLPQASAPQGGPPGFMKKPGRAIAEEAAAPTQTGGYAYFGPPVPFGGAEKIAATEPHRVEWLPKASPAEIAASGPDAQLQAMMMERPLETLQAFEMGMGNKGIDPAQRPLHRGYLADMMTKMGIMDDTEAITYIEHGMGENVARMKLNVRAQKAAGEMGEERLALAEARAAQGPAPSVPPMGLLKVEQEKATARLKKEGKWGAIFMNPYGQAIPELYNRGGGTLGAYGKGTSLSEIDTVLNKIMAGEMLNSHETEVAGNIVIVPTGGFAATMKEQTLWDLGKQLRRERQGQRGAAKTQGAPTPAPTQGPISKEAIAGFEKQARARGR